LKRLKVIENFDSNKKKSSSLEPIKEKTSNPKIKGKNSVKRDKIHQKATKTVTAIEKSPPLPAL
jgi:hypothetical protein